MVSFGRPGIGTASKKSTWRSVLQILGTNELCHFLTDLQSYLDWIRCFRLSG